MHNIDNSAVLDYCRKGNNLLDAAVSFAITGNDYESAPDVAFSGGTPDTPATGHAVLENGHIKEIVIDNPGAGYDTAPTITIGGVDDGGGAGATATATISGGAVNGVTITNSGGKSITVTDNTSYAVGEARAAVNVEIFDHFGGKLEFQIAAGDGDNAVTQNLLGLNVTEGLDANVTVVSDQGNIKDGSVHDIATLKDSGNFIMEI